MQTHARKVRRRNRFLVRLAWGAAAVVVLPLGYNYLGEFIKADPFGNMLARKSSPIDDLIGIRMDDVELSDYNGARLVSSATARRVDVRRDRTFATLYGVTKGVYNTSNGPLHYEAAQAVWNFQAKQVLVHGNVSVQNKDLDLTAKGLVFDDLNDMLTIPGAVTGKLYKGDVILTSLTYNTKTRAAETGPLEWTGMLALSPQDTDSDTVTPKKWDIKSSHMKTVTGQPDTYAYQNATASDGDLILIAPSVLQNKKTDVLTAEGGIQYYSGKADIIADKCVVYRKEKRVVLKGHVLMYVKPKSQENDPPKIETLPDFKPVAYDKVVALHVTEPLSKADQQQKEDEIRSTKNMRDFPLTIASTETQYWYGKGNRHAIITGDPQGRQSLKNDEWRYVWSHIALYDGEKETLKLVSTEGTKDARMKNSLGDSMMGVDLLVSTKEDDDFVEGNQTEGSIYTASDDTGKGDDKGPAPAGKGAAKTGAGTGSGTGKTGTGSSGGA